MTNYRSFQEGEIYLQPTFHPPSNKLSSFQSLQLAIQMGFLKEDEANNPFFSPTLQASHLHRRSFRSSHSNFQDNSNESHRLIKHNNQEMEKLIPFDKSVQQEQYHKWHLLDGRQYLTVKLA